MADPKYENLPGIDVNGRDVYESADLPEDDQHLASDDLDSTSVEVLDVDTTAAFSKFSGKYVSGAGKDFSGKIQGKHMTGYSTSEYGLAMPGEDETILQKYNRLKIEMGDLLSQVENIKKSKKEGASPPKLLQQIEALNSQLQGNEPSELSKNLSEEVNAEKVIASLKNMSVPSTGKHGSSKADGTYQLYLKPEQEKKQILKSAELEQRLARLEKVLASGSGDVNVLATHATSGSLIDAVEAIEAKLSLLDPEQLPQVDSRLQAILTKVNEINKAHKAGGDQPSEINQKITELYNLVRKWDGVRVGLPQLLSRLQALDALHTKASDFTSAVNHFELTQSQISSQLNTASSTQAQLLEMLKKNAATVETNMAQLQKRMEKLK
uniref:Dynactin subunit 2-like n=1 Tax=Phallusia mammillata TaxID=59560 RepID=A0A6F9DAS3_9ASCI|nr:dynactin subunit 2-like [Phallusia mammillata]